MSPTGLDLPVLMSDEHIRRREFVMTRRGYDPSQVREFLEQVADEVRQLGTLLQEARSQAETAARTASTGSDDPYAGFAERMAGVLRSVDQEAGSIRREAQADAERIITEARADADRIRTDAEARAEEIRTDAQAALREAREQADRTIGGLSTKRDALVEQLAAMQERLISVARDLESTIGAPEPVDVAAMLTQQADEGPQAPVTGPPWATGPGEGLQGQEHVTTDGTGSLEEAPEEPIVLGEADEAATEGPAGDIEEPEGDLDDDAQPALLDRSFEGMWEGTGTMRLEVPDIPPLDLDWGDLEKGPDEDR